MTRLTSPGWLSGQRRLHRVAHVLPACLRKLLSVDGEAVTPVRPSLLASNIKFVSLIERGMGGPPMCAWTGPVQVPHDRAGHGTHGRAARATLTDVLRQPLPTSLAAIATLPIAAKARGGVELVRAVHPHGSRLDLGGDVVSQRQILGPDG